MNKSNNALLYLLGSIVIAILIGIFFISPAFQKIQDSRIKHAEADNNYKTEKALSENIKKISNQSEELQDEIERLAVALPITPDTQSLIVQIDNIATESKIKLASISPQAQIDLIEELEPKTTLTNYKDINVAINLSGTYPQFKLFLEKLEQNLRVIDISSVSISPTLTTEEAAEEETVEGEEAPEVTQAPDQEYSIQINFKTYYQDE